jgi:hypothetical protein
VQSLFSEALARWQAVGADITSLADVSVQIADLGGTTLGLSSGNTIWLDANAAGWGWFVDATPNDDSEFTTRGDQGEQGKIDLLTVLMHEMGHLLGLGHSATGIMDDSLTTGTRLTPTSGDLFGLLAIQNTRPALAATPAMGRGSAVSTAARDHVFAADEAGLADLVPLLQAAEHGLPGRSR